MSCPDCFSGHQHDGKPAGKMIKLHGLDTYVVEPQDGREVKATIVIIPDAFGIEFVNNKLLADAYAAKGDYRVYLPDFMLGHSCPAWFLGTMRALVAPGNYLAKPYHVFWGVCAFIPWIYHTRPSRSFPTVKAFFTALRASTTLPTGAAGFCWGGKHTILLTHEANYSSDATGRKTSLIDAGFTGHPSMLDLPGDIDKITLPVSFALSEKDHHITVPEKADMVRRIVEERKEGEVRVYEGCGHGFCVRADPLAGEGDGFEKAVEAQDQAIAWFNKKLLGK